MNVSVTNSLPNPQEKHCRLLLHCHSARGVEPLLNAIYMWRCVHKLKSASRRKLSTWLFSFSILRIHAYKENNQPCYEYFQQMFSFHAGLIWVPIQFGNLHLPTFHIKIPVWMTLSPALRMQLRWSSGCPPPGGWPWPRFSFLLVLSRVSELWDSF